MNKMVSENSSIDKDYYGNIRQESDECKVNFITISLAQTSIPSNYKPIPYSHPEKIFYHTLDGKQIRREWLAFHDNKFFCVYCLCFSASDDNNPLIKGVEYVKNCKITEKLNYHQTTTHHKLAKETHLNLISNGSQEGIHRSESKEVIKTIVKIIIFIATHGLYFLN